MLRRSVLGPKQVSRIPTRARTQDSTSFRERSSRRRLVNLMREPSGESQRNKDNHIQTSDKFYPGPSQNDNTKGNYVEGRFQEIVPLNAGNVLGVEDSGPAAKWLSIIRQALNNQNSGPQVPDCYNGTVDAQASEERTCALNFSTEDETCQEDFARSLSSREEDSPSPPFYSAEQESHLQSDYTLVTSKKMLGLLLCVWVR